MRIFHQVPKKSKVHAEAMLSLRLFLLGGPRYTEEGEAGGGNKSLQQILVVSYYCYSIATLDGFWAFWMLCPLVMFGKRPYIEPYSY